MMATTRYWWSRTTAVADKQGSAVLLSGLVTIASYHYYHHVFVFPFHSCR